MSKLPALQFYPGDWKKDPGVQALSFHDRAVWFEMLLLMHESEQRGKLLLNGKPIPHDALARLIGLPTDGLTQALTTLLEFGVASKCEETGAIISRRMVRDEYLRQTAKLNGKKGGNPTLVNPPDNQQVNQKQTPSYSSSSSTSEKTHTVSSLQTQNTPQRTTEPPFKLLSCNRSEWAEIGECAIPPSLSVFQNEVFAWARHLRSMRGPNFDPNELETHMRDAVRLGRKFPGACEWAIRTRKEKLPNPKHEPDEKIDFAMWHLMRLVFDEGGKVPTVIGEKIGETALEAWVKLARQTLKGKFDDGEARAGYAAEFLGSIGTELPGRYFQILQEVCCG